MRILFALLAEAGDPHAGVPAGLERQDSIEAALVRAFFGVTGIERLFGAAARAPGCAASVLDATQLVTDAIPILPDAIVDALFEEKVWTAFAKKIADASQEEFPRIAHIIDAVRARPSCRAAARAALRLAVGGTWKYLLEFEHVLLEAEIDNDTIPYICEAVVTAAAKPAMTQRILAFAVPHAVAFLARRDEVAFALKLNAAGVIASSLAASPPPEPAALLVDFAAAFAAASAGFRAEIRDAIKAVAFSPRGRATAALLLLWIRVATTGTGGDADVVTALETGHRYLAMATPDRFTDEAWRVSREWAAHASE
jgi:hypothetical protein